MKNRLSQNFSVYMVFAISLLSTIHFSFSCPITKCTKVDKLNDGPFVFYQGDMIFVRELRNGNAMTKKYREGDQIKLDIAFDSMGIPSFSVNLKQKIANEPTSFKPAKKLFVLSDIEGEFEVLRSLLIDGGVIDNQYNWTFGSGHLVVAGDLFDRGKDVTQILWLLYRLEDLAKAKGGYVHVILGNHDIMNLSGDLRYVDKKYMDVAKSLSLDYMQLYSRDTELGRWLRSKNVIEKIGDVLVAHAGISPQINNSALNIEQINSLCRPYYDLPKSKLPKELSTYLGKEGLLWYRGYFIPPKVTEATIDSTLKKFGVQTIVVGHTIADNNVGFYYGGKVIGVDVDAHAGVTQAAFYKKGKWYKLASGKFSILNQGYGSVCGANFIPSTAVNQLEMWQADTFDPRTIDRELGYAAATGMNSMRVYLHHAAWKQDKKGFKRRIGRYLQIAGKHGIKTMFVFFDDCWKDTYQAGKQPDPVPSVHNSQWLKDPGRLVDDSPLLMDTLEMYVKDILKTFGQDRRVLMWDLYNEPGHFGRLEKSWPLLRNVVRWAREVKPSQPITIGVWSSDRKFADFNRFQLDNSDVITFHNYRDTVSLKVALDTLVGRGKPVICTEYMKRPAGSTFKDCLPIFKRYGIGAISWGLVAGKSQTNFPQGNKGGEAEPDLWYHDVFRKDGTPFDPRELEVISDFTGRRNRR